jgi:hypothetical protein
MDKVELNVRVMYVAARDHAKSPAGPSGLRLPIQLLNEARAIGITLDDRLVMRRRG